MDDRELDNRLMGIENNLNLILNYLSPIKENENNFKRKKEE